MTGSPGSGAAVARDTHGRSVLPFRKVNVAGTPAYRPDLQRHHILPVQLRRMKAFRGLFEAVEPFGPRFEDFRANGMLLPCRESAVLRLQLPLHRGPHRLYSEMVAERLGRIEAAWQAERLQDEETAIDTARMRIRLLQRALRKRLLAGGGAVQLNRRDPLRPMGDFTTLDAMVEELWAAT